jgi:hypothetical protein
MRTIKTLAGTPIELDGDALAVIETISRDLARRQELEYGFEDVDREIQHLIGQMHDDELRTYLKESLFMSFNRYENDRMLAIVKRASLATDERAQGREQRAKGKGQKHRTTPAGVKGRRSVKQTRPPSLSPRSQPDAGWGRDKNKGQRSNEKTRAKRRAARGSKRGRRT